MFMLEPVLTPFSAVIACLAKSSLNVGFDCWMVCRYLGSRELQRVWFLG